MLRISRELLEGEDGPRPRPSICWPDFRCRYEHSDDYYSEGHVCELPVGHDGPHRCELEWETRPANWCKALGHDWGEWKPLTASEEVMASVQRLVPLGDPFERKAPTKQRRCKRCGSPDDDGEYDYSALFPKLSPFSSKLPRT